MGQPGARFTRSFEDTCAWLTAGTTATVVCDLLRITWRSVSAVVVDRVIADRAGKTDMLGGLKRIGIDEIAHRRGHRYLTCVVDHDTGRLVWAAPGRNSETPDSFLPGARTERCSQLTHVTADGAEWIHTVITQRAPKAALCVDPFHIAAWATKALDEVRRQTWNQLRSSGDSRVAKTFKGSRWALIKNPRAPRGAWSYSRCSRERLEEISLGPMTYLDTERRRGQQHVRKLVTVSRYRNGAPGDPCDMAKTRLFEAQVPVMEMCILRHTTPGAEPPASGEPPLLRPSPTSHAVSLGFRGAPAGQDDP